MGDNLVLGKNNNALSKTIWALTLMCGAVLLLLSHVISLDNAKIYILIIKVAIVFILLIMFVAIIMGLGLLMLGKSSHRSWMYGILYKTLHFLFPFLYSIGKVLKLPKSEIRTSYININNKLVHLLFGQYKKEDALILTPHCLQNNECKIKVTGDPKNCRRCGKCDVQTLVELSEKYNMDLIVATGGTLARKAIEDANPKIIFAVACDRDLAAGIYDINSLPVIGVLNKMPNGPCFNTFVDVEKLENEINSFVK